MTGYVRHAFMAGLLLAVAPLGLAAPARAAGNPTANVLPVTCDRACLADALSGVLNALVTRDIGKLPLGNDVLSTQNGVKIRLDDGIWQVTDSLGKYRVDFIDPESGQAATFATLSYGGKTALVALRIATWEQKIHEIEFIIAAGTGAGPMGNAGEQIEKTGAPRAKLLRSLPEAERMSRADLIRIANSYFSNLQGSTGKTSAPFAPTCLRLENGAQTSLVPVTPPAAGAAPPANRGGIPNIVAMNCEDQQKSGFFPFVTSIRDRRFPVVDRERGIVLSFGFFDHSGTVSEILLTNGTKVNAPLRAPTTFMMAEAFQIEKDKAGAGRIDQVEAVMASAPYKMRNAVWTEGDHVK